MDNLVPIGSESLGTAAKTWSAVYADKIVGVKQYRQLTDDVATSSTSLADVAGLTGISLKAGGVYHFRVRAGVTANATTVGVLVSLNASAAVTSIRYTHKYATAANTFTEELVTTLQGGTTPTTSAGTAQTEHELEGFVTAASDCTLSVQHKSETATSTSVKNGSYIIVTRVA